MIDNAYTADIKAVAHARIATLIQFELEPVEYAILELLQRSRKLHPTAVALPGKNGGGLWKKQLMTIEPTCLLWPTSAPHARVNGYPSPKGHCPAIEPNRSTPEFSRLRCVPASVPPSVLPQRPNDYMWRLVEGC